jgi:Metallo-peptidase family M12B Reprolysin-like
LLAHLQPGSFTSATLDALAQLHFQRLDQDLVIAMKETAGSRSAVPFKSLKGAASKTFRSPQTILCCVLIAAVAAGFLPYLNAPAGAAPSKGEGLANAGTVVSQDGLWQQIEEQNPSKNAPAAGVVPKSYRIMRLNQAARAELLGRAPLEFSKAAGETQVVIALPMPNKTFSRFRIEESPIMEPSLAARFPEIKTYRGKGIDDPTATLRFDWTPAGLHAVILSAHATVFIEPYTRGDAGTYINYYKHDLPTDADTFLCSTLEAQETATRMRNRLHKAHAPLTQTASAGTILRTYRLALAATAEYTQVYGGGSVSGALAAMTTTMNLVNAVYERELAIRLVLVANETDIIFTNAATDGYTSDDANTMYNQNQSILDARIGAANYDIGYVFDGHIFNFTPGRYFYQGRGEVGSVCVAGLKAKGVSIFRSLEPSAVTAVFITAHEMGHKFGATHTFNGTTTSDCANGRVASTAYEPVPGSTIMGYRGTAGTNTNYFPLCGGEDLHSTDTYFHAASIQQITAFTTTGSGSSCAGQIATGNHPPTVNAGPNYNIPRSTPFTLTAQAADPESDALTYCWEQYDLGPAAPPNTDDGLRPIFRSFAPSASPARTFPQLTDILSGVQTFGESLPVTTRALNFRVTVRDNHAGGGATGMGSMRVNVIGGSGPFTVTQPTSAAVWTIGSTQTVTWNVANTSSAPVGCTAVRILLSLDGGNTFNYTLASDTPNDGAAAVSVPNIPTTTARVKVEAVGNVFFNVSPQSFSIAPPAGTNEPVLLTEENSSRAVALDSVTMMRDPFPLTSTVNFSTDQHTRVSLFAVGIEALPGEDLSTLTAQAEDAQQRVYPLRVEYVGRVPNFSWLTQIVVRLPDNVGSAKDLWVSINWRGIAGNKVVVGIK